MIEIKVNKRSTEALVHIQKAPEKTRAGIKTALYEMGAKVKRNLRRDIRKTSTKTGRMYGNHQASASGEFPANETGRLLKSVDYTARPMEMEFGTNTPYAKYLEDKDPDSGGREHVGRMARESAEDFVEVLIRNVDQSTR